MIREDDLRKTIFTIMNTVKHNHEECLTVSNHVAALRQALIGAGGEKFQTLFDSHLNALEAKTAAYKASILAEYDEILIRVKDGLAF